MRGFRAGTVVHRQVWAPGLVTIRVEAEAEPLIPGQFYNLALPVDDSWVRRAYSAASAPGAALEFLVTRVEQGDLTPELTELPVGAPIWVDPHPHGHFTLADVPAVPDLWLCATGTGLAPFVSMLRTPEPLVRFARVVLVHGVRHGSHLVYADELDALSRDHGGRFVRVPVVSRADTPGALRGRITERLADGAIERRVGASLTPEGSHVLLCGNPAMIDEMMALLGARGLRRHRTRSPGHVTFERYW